MAWSAWSVSCVASFGSFGTGGSAQLGLGTVLGTLPYLPCYLTLNLPSFPLLTSNNAQTYRSPARPSPAQPSLAHARDTFHFPPLTDLADATHFTSRTGVGQYSDHALVTSICSAYLVTGALSLGVESLCFTRFIVDRDSVAYLSIHFFHPHTLWCLNDA